jgi:uncharacterized protein (TIGR00369 family)
MGEESTGGPETNPDPVPVGAGASAPISHFRRLERMYHAAPVTRLYGTRLEVREGEATVTLPVREEFFHAAGALHGSAYFRALDDAAFFAANSVVRDRFVLTVSFTVELRKPVTEGTLTARGSLRHRAGGRLQAEATLVDEEGREVARGEGVFLARGPALTPEIGYR